MRHNTAYLMQSATTGVAVKGALAFEEGRLTFTLAPKRPLVGVKWLEKALGTQGIADRLEAGEEIVVFDTDVKDARINWPITMGGVAMKIQLPTQTWRVSLEQPTADLILNLPRGRRDAKAWRAAFAEAGVR